MEKVFLRLFLSSTILVSVSAMYYPYWTEDPCPGPQMCTYPNQVLPNCDNCQCYFRCLWGRKIDLSCPYGMFFNVHTLDCDHSSSQCGSRPIMNPGAGSPSNVNSYANFYHNRINNNNNDYYQNNNNIYDYNNNYSNNYYGYNPNRAYPPLPRRPVGPPTAMRYGGNNAISYNLSEPAVTAQPSQPKEPDVLPWFDTDFLKKKFPGDDDKNVVYRPHDDVNNTGSSYYDIYHDLLTSDSGVIFSTSQYHEQEIIY